MNYNATFMKKQTSFLINLPKDIQDAIILYTQQAYQTINNFLEGYHTTFRNNTEKVRILNTISKLDYAFDKAPPTKQEITLYRGLELPYFTPDKRNKSRLLLNYRGRYLGFISTSLDENAAETFARNKCCVLKIIVPPGTKLLYVASISEFAEEQEVVIPRKSILETIGFEKTQEGTTVIVTKLVQTSFNFGDGGS